MDISAAGIFGWCKVGWDDDSGARGCEARLPWVYLL